MDTYYWIAKLYTNVFCPVYGYITGYTDFKEMDPLITKGQCYHTFDMLNDTLKMYYTIRGHKYILCLSRHTIKSPLDMYCKIVEMTTNSGSMANYKVLDAQMNDAIRLTDRINSHIGDDGVHLRFAKLKLKWLLSPQEIASFKKLVILTDDLEELEFTSPEDYIVI